MYLAGPFLITVMRCYAYMCIIVCVVCVLVITGQRVQLWVLLSTTKIARYYYYRRVSDEIRRFIFHLSTLHFSKIMAHLSCLKLHVIHTPITHWLLAVFHETCCNEI